MKGKKPYDLNQCRKRSWQNSTFFLGKNTQQTKNRRKLISAWQKQYTKKLHREQHTKWWNTESFSSKIRNKWKMSAFATSIQHSTGSSTYSNLAKRKK